jgi:hypothetical protein
MDYLKLFDNHAEYEGFVSGGTMVRPNVSHCVQENDIHYNAIPIMTVRYNVTDASNPTQLYDYWIGANDNAITGELMFDKAVIDGVEASIADLDAASGKTQFSVGEHTVKYTLKDPTLIGIEEDEQTTKIGATFFECISIISVNIPNSVTSIGDNAFDNCSSLTSVTIPDSVTSIGDRTFKDCTGLTSVTIPDSVTSIGSEAFRACGLRSIIIPNSVTTISALAFYGCWDLISVTLGNGITTIGDSAFCFCLLDESSQSAIREFNPKAINCRG